MLPIQYTGQVRFGGRRDNRIDFRAWATPQEVTQALVVGPRVRDPEQPRRTSFRDGLPCRKKDDQKLKGIFTFISISHECSSPRIPGVGNHLIQMVTPKQLLNE